MDYPAIVTRAIRTGAILSGIRNCHVKGLYSLVVQERRNPQDGMLRLFYAAPGCPLDHLYDDAGEFILMPHNHRQDIHLIHLSGYVVNVRFVFMDRDRNRTRSRRFFQYTFSSELVDGGLGLEIGAEAPFYADAENHPLGLYPGNDLMSWKEYHTVRANPGSIWIVKEGPLAPHDAKSIAWSTLPNKQLSSEGLYVPMEQDELADVVVTLRDILSGYQQVA